MKIFLMYLSLVIMTGEPGFVTSTWKTKLIEVKAENGGPNGFYSSNIDCNEKKGTVSIELNDSGYAPVEFCNYDKLEQDVLILIEKVGVFISNNKVANGTLKQGTFILKYKVTDMGNFWYEIRPK